LTPYGGVADCDQGVLALEDGIAWDITRIKGGAASEGRRSVQA
jgi:hypothetical protein